MGVDDCLRITPWNVSWIGVKSDKLRLISMNVFLMMRLRDAPLSISVLAIRKFSLWVILWSERNVRVESLHSLAWLNLLG
jgi:hypothetical protein